MHRAFHELTDEICKRGRGTIVKQYILQLKGWELKAQIAFRLSALRIVNAVYNKQTKCFCHIYLLQRDNKLKHA